MYVYYTNRWFVYSAERPTARLRAERQDREAPYERQESLQHVVAVLFQHCVCCGVLLFI